MSEVEATASQSTWRFARPEEDDQPSLREVNSSIAVPNSGVWFRRLFAFMGPGYMVSVGYMDPGNWARLAGGVVVGIERDEQAGHAVVHDLRDAPAGQSRRWS